MFSISQKQTSSWNNRGKTYSKYVISITNKSPHETVTSLQFSIQDLYGPLWGLSKPNANKFYSFPKWLKSLSPGQILDFVYIHVGPPVVISIVNYQMNWSITLIFRVMESSGRKNYQWWVSCSLSIWISDTNSYCTCWWKWRLWLGQAWISVLTDISVWFVLGYKWGNKFMEQLSSWHYFLIMFWGYN